MAHEEGIIRCVIYDYVAIAFNRTCKLYKYRCEPMVIPVFLK